MHIHGCKLKQSKYRHIQDYAAVETILNGSFKMIITTTGQRIKQTTEKFILSICVFKRSNLEIIYHHHQ